MQFGGHHSVQEYSKELPPNELMMYTWEDATLRELTDLIKSAQPAAKRNNARLEFALVYPDKKGRNVMRQVWHCFWCCNMIWSTKLGCPAPLCNEIYITDSLVIQDGLLIVILCELERAHCIVMESFSCHICSCNRAT